MLINQLMKSLIMAIPAIVFLVISALPIPAPAQPEAIEGKVIDKTTREPIQSAFICLLKKEGKPIKSNILHSTLSDKNGGFVINTAGSEENFLGFFCLGYEEKIIPCGITGKNDLQIELKNISYILDDIEVKSLKLEIPAAQSSIPVTIISKDYIERIPSLTLPEILNYDPAITLSREGVWSTGINLRGFRENRIVFIIDGARIETATDVAGAFSMINNENIKKIEIIKGASSSIYGSKAMGGVVQVFTNEAGYRPGFSFRGSATSGFQSANKMFSENLELSFGNKNWYLDISGFNRNAKSIKTPAGTLVNSAFNDQGLSMHMGYKPAVNHEINLNLQYFHGWDIGIPGGTLFPQKATVRYRNADRNLLSFSYKIEDINGIFNEVSLNYHRQSIYRNVDIDPGLPSEVNPVQLKRINPTGLHIVNGLTIQGRKDLGNVSLLTGIDLWQRALNTERKKELTINTFDSTGLTISQMDRTVVEKPLPDARAGNMGFFMHLDHHLADNRLHILVNSRVDYINNSNEPSFNPLYTITNGSVDRTPANQEIIYKSESNDLITWGANFGLNYDIGNSFTTTINLGRSFRAPSIEELYKFIDLGSRVEYGNPELETENGYFLDMGLVYKRKKIQLDGHVYINRLNNLITPIRIREIPFDHHLDMMRSRDEIIIFQNNNIDETQVHGFESRAEYTPGQRTHLYANMGYVVGRDIKNNSFLPLMPPFHGKIGIRNTWLNLVESDLSATFFREQDKVAEGEFITDGYCRFDLYLSTKNFEFQHFQIRMTGGVENIFNDLYANHLTASRNGIIYEPGRNLFFKAKLIW